MLKRPALLVPRGLAKLVLADLDILVIQIFQCLPRRGRRFFDLFGQLSLEILCFCRTVGYPVDLPGLAELIDVVDTYTVLLFTVFFAVHFVDRHDVHTPFAKKWLFPEWKQPLIFIPRLHNGLW